jgi:hypothetical protein
MTMIFHPTRPDPAAAYVRLGNVIDAPSASRARLVSFMRANPDAIMVHHPTTGDLRALAPEGLDDINLSAFWRGVLRLFNEPLWTPDTWDRSTIHIRVDQVDAFRAAVLEDCEMPSPAVSLEKWYHEHSLRNPKSTETEDWEAAKAHFQHSIKRDTIRDLRRDPNLRPHHVRNRRGRPSKNSAGMKD